MSYYLSNLGYEKLSTLKIKIKKLHDLILLSTLYKL